MKNSLLNLPKRKAEFNEPECAPVTKLLDAESLRAETDAQLDKAVELIRWKLSDPPHAGQQRDVMRLFPLGLGCELNRFEYLLGHAE